MERPENVDFVLNDIKSNILDSYVNSLENRINKAIEYIEERYNGEVLTHTFDKDNVKELLEILDKVEDNK